MALFFACRVCRQLRRLLRGMRRRGKERRSSSSNVRNFGLEWLHDSTVCVQAEREITAERRALERDEKKQQRAQNVGQEGLVAL